MDIIISNSSGKPIYEQITDQIKAHIMAGTLVEGDPLPSLRALARDLRISVITTKRSYDDLERDGFIETVAGKGCFVARQQPGLLREQQVRAIEEVLQKALDMARQAGLSPDEVIGMIRLLQEET